MSSDTCVPHHDWFTALLTFGLCCGIVISYVPQHFRIIHKASSEGFSPWFLLLGCTSAAAGFLNMVTLQWGIVKCCRVLTFGSCLEVTAGVIQIGLQWVMFNLILVLYIIYYPPHLKYVEIPSETDGFNPAQIGKELHRTSDWLLSVILAWVVVIHLILISFTTFFLLRDPPPPSSTVPLDPKVSEWATFLGVTSALLAAVQYAPQLVHTYRMKLVGALSIPMMLIQSPGSVLMVLSIALRPGTNWTSWITFAVAGTMQGSLLVMCIAWKYRQRKLGIDDFGHRLTDEQGSIYRPSSEYSDDVPGLVTGDEDPAVVRAALARALEAAVEEDVRSMGLRAVEEIPISENTPLLSSVQASNQSSSWMSMINSRTKS